MRKVPFIDSTGIHNLTNLCRISQQENTRIILSGVNPKVHEVLHKAGFYSLLGEENICPNINAALRRAKELVVEPKEKIASRKTNLPRLRKASAKQKYRIDWYRQGTC